MRRFEYLAPATLEEAISALSDHEGEAKVLAGGTDLLIYMKSGRVAPSYLVDIKRIPGLDRIAFDEAEGLRIGALTRLADVADHPIIRERFPMAAAGAESIGTIQVRNKGTIGGNLCNAAPSADMAPPIIAFGTAVKIVGPKGERTLPLDEFFLGPGRTVLGAGDILTEIIIPTPPERSGGVYLRIARRSAIDIAAVGVAAHLTLDGDGTTCRDVRIVLGAVAPIPLRAKDAEGLLNGKRLEAEIIAEAGRRAAEESKPISDVRSSAAYRREMVNVLTKRALEGSLAMVTNGRGCGMEERRR